MRKIYLALFLVVTACLVVLILFLATRNNQPGITQVKKDGKVITIKWFRVGLPEFQDNDPILTAIQTKTGIKLKFINAPWDGWLDKINLLITTGEEVDLVMLPYDAVPYQAWAEEGLIIDWAKYVTKSKHPYLYSLIHSERGRDFWVGGKAVLIPQITAAGTWGLMIRKDWLDRLKLPVPKTITEFRETLRAFRDRDPDGNFKNDTAGLYAGFEEGPGGVNLIMVSPFMHAYGGIVGPHLYLQDNKEFYYEPEISDSQREAYRQLRQMYREGLINQDAFRVTQKQAKDKFLSGTVGMTMYDNSPFFIMQEMNDKKARVIQIAPPIGPGGKRGFRGAPRQSWLGAVIPKSCRNPQKAVDIFEFMASEEGRRLVRLGVKGVHYHQKGERIAFNPQIFYKWYGTHEFPASWGLTYSGIDFINTIKYPDFEDALKRPVYWKTGDPTLESYGEFAMFNREFVTTSPVEINKIPGISSLTSQVSTALSNWRAKFLLDHDIDIDAVWDNYVNDIKRSGVAEIMRLLNASTGR